MIIKRKNSNIQLFVLTLQLFLRNGFCDIWGANDFVFGSIRLRDLSFMVAVIWSASIILTHKGYQIKNDFSKIMWCGIGLVFVSCFASYLFFSQPISLGIQAQRDIFAGYLMFFSINILVQKDIISNYSVIKVVKYTAVIQMILNTINWLVFSTNGVLIFSGTQVSMARYGGARLFFSQTDTIVLLIAICLNEFLGGLAKNKIRIIDLIYIVWGLIYFLIFTKLRFISVAIIASIGITILLWRKSGLKKSVLIIGIGIGVFLFGNRIPLIQDVIETIFGWTSLSVNTMEARGAAQLYYLTKLMSSPLIGYGYPHSSWAAATVAQGSIWGYFLSDNGIFSFMYIYGSLGCVWLLFLVAKYIHLAKTNYVKYDDYIGITWGIYTLISIYTGMFWAIGNTQLPFVIMLVYLSKEARSKRLS